MLVELGLGRLVDLAVAVVVLPVGRFAGSRVGGSVAIIAVTIILGEAVPIIVFRGVADELDLIQRVCSL